ncbi:hypothetical protein HPP92_026026 [Vanilla planifolia]|uniref:Uncharacterized protein n=1 Tax=Vanilla planifolia TaxID=51239 RepID=A0A835U7V3_VANPL|nr:hypothetical protein HPP92_026302 [Vanilla planifolia]KAG0451768.1 hypothetical protein HPP92_026026 [Vanilla planifolia]
MSSASKHWGSFSLPSLLRHALNLLLFTLSSASLVPILLLQTPPTPFGWAFLAVSLASIFSSLLGLFSHASLLRFLSHALLSASALVGQALGLLSLLLHPEPCLRLLGQANGSRNAKALEKTQAGALAGMLALEAVSIVWAFAEQRCREGEHDVVEKEKRVTARRRSGRVAIELEGSVESADGGSRGEGDGREDEKKRTKGDFVLVITS